MLVKLLVLTTAGAWKYTVARLPGRPLFPWTLHLCLLWNWGIVMVFRILLLMRRKTTGKIPRSSLPRSKPIIGLLAHGRELQMSPAGFAFLWRLWRRPIIGLKIEHLSNILGWALDAMGVAMGIDRGNRERASVAIKAKVNKYRNRACVFWIYPEGTRPTEEKVVRHQAKPDWDHLTQSLLWRAGGVQDIVDAYGAQMRAVVTYACFDRKLWDSWKVIIPRMLGLVLHQHFREGVVTFYPYDLDGTQRTMRMLSVEYEEFLQRVRPNA